MKRKIFSKLLMGAFLFASVSAFVSCKDYDDDINANKADIKAAQEQLATLTSNLTSLKSQVEAQKTALEQDLATAKSQLETQIATAKAELNAAIEKKADQTTVDGLATKVATLESNLSALRAAYEQKIAALDSALASLQALIDKKADITYVDNAIATLQSVLEGKIAIVDQNKVSKDDFNAFKTEVAALQSALETLKTLANGKADQKDLDNAVEKINEKIAALQKQMETVVPQSALEKMSETITGIRTSIDALSQTIAAKANQSALDELSARVDANYKELKAQANALVTPEQLAEAIAALKSEIEKKGDAKTAELEKAIADLEEALNKKIAGVEETASKNLADAVETINTALGTKANASDLENAIAEFREAKDIIVQDIATKYAAVTGDIDGINKTLGEIQETLKTKAAQSDLEELGEAFAEFVILQGVTNGVLDNRLIACEALIEQVAAINTFLGDLEEGGLAKKLADLKEEMSKKAQDALDEEIGKREKAIEDVTKAITDLETDLNDKIAKAQEDYNKKIEAANKNHEDLMKLLYGDGTEDEDATIGDINQLKQDFSQIDEKIQTGIDANLSNLMVFIQRMLTSVTLIPQLYIDGIEAIQFTSIRYIPQVPDYSIKPENYANAEGYDAFTWNNGWTGGDYILTEGTNPGFYWMFADHQLANKTVGNKVVDPLTIDNGETLAEYRVSPRNVDINTIDVDNIKMYSTVAATATRAATLGENTPVKPTFVSLAANGNLTVKLQKTVTGSIRFNGEGTKGTIVSLSVPRKADAANDVEAQEIFSEYSLLDEQTILPRIAALPWVTEDDHDAASPMDYHFIDSLHIFNSQTDKDLYVKAEIDYDKPFDLLTLVTGCKAIWKEGRDGWFVDRYSHDEITKAELAKYGLAFRFELPETYATPGDINMNYSNQQEFAMLSGDNPHNIIQAKLPQDLVITGNRAVIGKEPIVRVMLVDTVHNCNLVDQAYFKVKFVDNVPDKDPIPVEFTATQTLNCENNIMKVTWKQFINEVYAQLKNSEGEATGMSWEDFRKYYPQDNVIRLAKPNNFAFQNEGSYIYEGEEGNGRGEVDIWWLSTDVTQSPYSDANELWWTLNANDIKTIPLDKRYKEFTTVVRFNSNDSKVYGPIDVTLKFKIELPQKPTIIGYNENQWFKSQEKFYVQPVQYGTTNNNGVRPEHVQYDFNMTQQFVVNTSKNAEKNIANGTWTNWIIKGLPYDCGAWDVQFASAQNGLKYRSAYNMNAAGGPKWSEPNNSSQIVTDNLAYLYINEAMDSALTIKWRQATEKYNENHYSWTNWDSDDVANPYFILHGDSATADQIIPLLNDLSLENRPDGWTPEKTFDDNKAVDLKVWAHYNEYNWEEITAFKAYLVTPIRINFTAPGAFEDNYVSGTMVDATGKLSITDFVGYAVAKSLASFPAKLQTQERYRYAEKLWKYYGLSDPEFDLNPKHVLYGLKIKNGNLVVDDDVQVNETGSAVINGGMTAAQVSAATAEGYTPSLTFQDGYLLYKNKQGREFEKPYNIFVPVSVKHIFGTLKTYVPFPVYPKGFAEADGYEIIEGPVVNARKR